MSASEGLLKSGRSKGGCVNLVLQIGPICGQGGEGVKNPENSADVLNGSPLTRLTQYRARLRGGPQVWWILFLLLLTLNIVYKGHSIRNIVHFWEKLRDMRVYKLVCLNEIRDSLAVCRPACTWDTVIILECCVDTNNCISPKIWIRFTKNYSKLIITKICYNILPASTDELWN